MNYKKIAQRSFNDLLDNTDLSFTEALYEILRRKYNPTSKSSCGWLLSLGESADEKVYESINRAIKNYKDNE